MLRGAGIEVSKKMAMAALKRVPGRLFTKFGEKGMTNAGGAIPVLGGLVGGGVDAIWTKAVVNQARNIFTPD